VDPETNVPAPQGITGVEVQLHETLKGVAPGQSMVLYDDTRVIGQATISEAHSSAWDPSVLETA
jgi:tRNA-specific 2-thiouridylase